MTRWNHRIMLKDLLDDDDSDKHAQELGKVVAERLRKSNLFVGTNLPTRFEKVADLDHFNAIMGRLYDYCDERLIWVE